MHHAFGAYGMPRHTSSGAESIGGALVSRAEARGAPSPQLPRTPKRLPPT